MTLKKAKSVISILYQVDSSRAVMIRECKIKCVKCFSALYNFFTINHTYI